MSDHVCPVKHARVLDSRLRRLIHNPKKILRGLITGGQTVLDLGCGPGTFTIDMAEMAGPRGKVFAADLQTEMLALVEKKARKHGVRDQVVLCKCDSEDLGVKEPVDFVLAFYMLHESGEPGNLLRQIRDVLKPGGKFLLVEPKMHVSEKTYQEAVSLAVGNGMDIISERKIPLSRSVLMGKN